MTGTNCETYMPSKYIAYLYKLSLMALTNNKIIYVNFKKIGKELYGILRNGTKLSINIYGDVTTSMKKILSEQSISYEDMFGQEFTVKLTEYLQNNTPRKLKCGIKHEAWIIKY